MIPKKTPKIYVYFWDWGPFLDFYIACHPLSYTSMNVECARLRCSDDGDEFNSSFDTCNQIKRKSFRNERNRISFCFCFTRSFSARCDTSVHLSASGIHFRRGKSFRNKIFYFFYERRRWKRGCNTRIQFSGYLYNYNRRDVSPTHPWQSFKNI